MQNLFEFKFQFGSSAAKLLAHPAEWAATSGLNMITIEQLARERPLDIRRGGLRNAPPSSFFDLPNARLIRKTIPHGSPNPTLYIVAVSKADQAVEIIRSRAADAADTVEDLGRVAGVLVRAFKLAPGEFIRVDGNYKPQAELDRADSH
jgi:hypothetical protein